MGFRYGNRHWWSTFNILRQDCLIDVSETSKQFVLELEETISRKPYKLGASTNDNDTVLRLWWFLAVVLSPEPLLTTSETGTPSSEAMKPSTEKMANPANTEVQQLPKHTIRVSLETSRTLANKLF